MLSFILPGEAAAILTKAQATATSITLLGSTMAGDSGHAALAAKAVAFRVAEQYVAVLERVSRKANTILLPGSDGLCRVTMSRRMDRFHI